MASPAQVTANQANAQFSTGPRSPEGKARVSQNALSHGLTSRHLVIRPDEREEFSALQDSLLAELDPQGAVETVTFHELLHAAWSLHRFRRLEAESTPADFSESPLLDRLGRYQARAQRAYYKALHELRTLQTNRALRSIKLTQEGEADTPAIAAINELTKQTHSEVTAEAIKQAIQMLEYDSALLKRSSLQTQQARTTPATMPVPQTAAPTSPQNRTSAALGNPALRL